MFAIKIVFFVTQVIARCTYCASDFNITLGGRNDVTTHMRGKLHKEMAEATSSTRSVASYYRPQTPQSVIESESLWLKFVAKHNLSFQTSDHATKLFHQMFPDSEIARKFSCRHTNKHDTSKFFSVLMDESNDKADKSCIILVRIFDAEV